MLGTRAAAGSLRPASVARGGSVLAPSPPPRNSPAAGEARRSGSPDRPRLRLSAARLPAAGHGVGRWPGGELCAGLGRRRRGGPDSPLTRPGPAAPRPICSSAAPRAGPRACQVEEQLAADSRRPLLDPVPRKTSSVGFCSLAADSSENASTRSEYLNSLASDFFFF